MSVHLTPAARQAFAEERCRMDGHDFEHVVTITGELVCVICGCCGRAWKAEPQQ